MNVTYGFLTFAYHGSVIREKLLSRYWKAQQDRYYEWQASIGKIDVPLLDTTVINKRKHLELDQYFEDPVPQRNRLYQIEEFACPAAQFSLKTRV